MAAEPTFLFCVGATKAGTSWLYDHLSAHPECHFRSLKELHYFDNATPAQFDAALSQGEKQIAVVKDRIARADPVNPWAVRQLADLQDWQAVLAKRATDLDAYRDYLTQDLGTAHLVGDVTPSYALLPGARLRQLADTGADVRVIYLIRDPLDRLWSHVRMVAHRLAPAQFAATALALIDRIISGDLSGEGEGIVKRGDYRSILPKLARVFDPSRLLVLFFEDMLSVAGVAKLSAFLGITPRDADFGRRAHPGQALPLPLPLQDRARAFLRPQYDYVATQFRNIPAAWRENMEEGIA